MQRVSLGLCTAAALCAGAWIGCEAAEQPGEPGAAALPQAVAETAAQKSQEAASRLTVLGFVDDRDVVQVLNFKLGNRLTYEPATIVVTAGSGRRLSIFNDTDAPRGFCIPGLAVAVLLPVGEELLVELPPLVGPQIYGIECPWYAPQVPQRYASLVVLPARPSGG